ncbi:hypothetical protein FRC18_007554 [Serendipita sp. 400]|nr:hypothetical protein FRC18_007554 [Serendipita sp. 400]
MIHLVAASLGDLLITSVTILCIQRANRRTVHPRKRSRIQQIARLTAVSAAVPTLLAIINVILVINPDKDVARWHIVPNFLIPSTDHSIRMVGQQASRRATTCSTRERRKERGASPAALAGAAGGSGRKRGVEDLVERGGGKAPRYPVRMEVITDEQGERRTSLGFLNRTSMFARTVMTPTGTEMTGEETDQVAADLESQWDAVNSREMERKKKYGEMSVIDSLDTARWEEKIGRDG